MDFESAKNSKGESYLKVALDGFALLANPLLNKGMSFSQQEREEFKLIGLIPPFETNMQIQLMRSYAFYQSKPSSIEKYIYLRDLQDSNEILFYRLLVEYIEEMTPIVYTPTVGFGCEQYSHIYRRPRGVYIAYPDRNQINKILAHPNFDNVKIVVVSDGERILGLGDQGAGGMGIPIGKLALYSACAGIHPSYTLPILLDTGTNNLALQKDPLYIGWHHERVRGNEYDAFIELFVQAVKERFPNVLLQWEDFAQQNANPILSRYRDTLCTFNDDIQGTAAVAAGTLFAAINVTGTPLREQRIVVVGAGSAGCGISYLLKQALIEEGLSDEEARQHFYLIDKSGLLLDSHESLLPFQKPFAQPRAGTSHWKLNNPPEITLEDVIFNVHPTALIGVSGQTGIFTEKLVREMAAHVERPVIFPLSNPTLLAEADPGDILFWTNDRALVSTGSPFEKIMKKGELFRIDQTNNSYIFPGLGLGLIAVQATRVTDKMLMIAARALALCSPTLGHPDANLLPPLTEIRDVSFKIALAVAQDAINENLATFIPENLSTHIKSLMWHPEYLPYKKWIK